VNTPTWGGPAVDLRRAFRSDASSVWTVTTAHAGLPVGFTAVSVTSVSLAPPLLSFNVSRTSSSLHALVQSGRFAVHLLSADQEDVARRFAADAALRFGPDTRWRWAEDGLPHLDGVVTRVAGAVLRLVEAGDSLLVLGEVHRVDGADDPLGRPEPLVHHDRTYTRPAVLEGAVA
jgi:flavin reductase (DIM6/NTAB) family NADH-FMN oxidoreductase RutF